MENNLSNNLYLIFSLTLNSKYLLAKSLSIYQYISLPLVCKEINFIFKKNLTESINIEILNEIILFSGLDSHYISKCIKDKKTLFSNIDYLGDELLNCYFTKNIVHKNYYESYIQSLSQDKFYPIGKYIFTNYNKYKKLNNIINSSKNLKLILNNAEKPTTQINNILYSFNSIAWLY